MTTHDTNFVCMIQIIVSANRKPYKAVSANQKERGHVVMVTTFWDSVAITTTLFYTHTHTQTHTHTYIYIYIYICRLSCIVFLET